MGIEFIDEDGSFFLENPQNHNYLYFPVANEGPTMGSVTPDFRGDSKLNQNAFLLEPVSAENLSESMSGRNFWCITEGGIPWSATGESAWQQIHRQDENKDCVQLIAGKLWQCVRRTNEYLEIGADVCSFCPPTSEHAELMQITIHNLSNERKTITPVAAIPIYGRSADNIRDHRHVTSLLGRIQTEQNGVTVKPTLSFDERGHRKNEMTYSVLASGPNGEKPVGFYPVVQDFIGEGGSLYWPGAITANQNTVGVNEEAEGFEAMGGIRFAPMTLSPKESRTYQIVLSYNHEGLRYLDENEMKQARYEVKKYWEQQEIINCSSSEQSFDKWMGWVGIQPTLRRIYGCSFMPHHDYGRGGRGWRDLWQDSLALILRDPQTVRESLVNYFGGVRIDGSNATIIGNKPGEFIADRNSIVRVWMDHGLWPLITTNLYIEQTGDYLILLEKNTYFKDQVCYRGEAVDEQWDGKTMVLTDAKNCSYKGSILEHILVQHLTAFYDVGTHNHMRLRGADWNDALDMAEEYGESVAFTAAYSGNLITLANLVHQLQNVCGLQEIYLAEEIEKLLYQPVTLYHSIVQKNELLKSYCESCRHTVSGHKIGVSLAELEHNLRDKAEWIQVNIRKKEFVGDGKGQRWYNGYYDDHREPVEGVINGNVRMMLTSQVFTIMSGTASDEQIATIVKAADQYLYEPSMGGYRLNTNFHEVKSDLGRMFGFAYGHKENGAVFCHMAVMYAYSLYSKGFAKEGYRALHSLYSQGIDFDKSHIYPGIPEYYDDRGRGCYHYLTGAASWYVYTVLTEMYGVKGRAGDLLFQPKLLADQFDEENKASVTLWFAGRKLTVTYLNEKKKEIGDYEVEEIRIDQKLYETYEVEYPKIVRKEIEQLAQDEEHEICVVLS
ncbi:MAG: cellobiose phosphorylase [Hespellia sp.]|nr:cellobiose phosphorylase [Hespellia sp.]